MRHPKQLQRKSRQHTITRFSDHHYKVTSGTSGEIYHVNPVSCNCTCAYGSHRPANDKRSGCSHLIATLDYIRRMEDERRIMVCGSEEEAAKSKRQVAGMVDGLILLSRKV